MRKYWTVLLIAVLAAGCASVSALTKFSSENQEEQVQKLLIGTWSGYIKDTPWYRMPKPDITLQIYGVHKEQNGWKVNASLNWRSLEYIKIYVEDNTVRLEMMGRYGGFYTLELYGNTHLLGNVIFGRGRWLVDPHDIVLKKYRVNGKTLLSVRQFAALFLSLTNNWSGE